LDKSISFFPIMMKIVAVALILLSPIDAHRVNVNRNIDSEAIESESGAHFFHSCDNLQTMFRTRVENIQALQEAHPDEPSFSATTRARFMMRTFGAIRILRRARECSWVVDGNVDNMDHVRGVAHSAIAGNPCGDAALEALSALASPENELQPLQQAVQILFSDNCEVPSEGMQTEAVDLNDGEALSNRLTTAEEEAQDHIDDLMDAAAAESEDIASGAFIQTEGVFRRVSSLIGAVFLSILYLLSCAAVGAVIGGFLLFVVGMIPCSIIVQGPGVLGCFLWPMAGVALGAASGLVNCGVDLANAHPSQLPR